MSSPEKGRFHVTKSLRRPIASLTIVIAFASIAVAQSNPGNAQGTAAAPPAVRHDIDGVWAAGIGGAPRDPLVDPRLRPPMTPWGQAKFDAAVPSSRSPGPEGDRVVPGKE